MILYLKDHKNCARKFLDLINIFRKVAECNINIQKQVGYMFTVMNMLRKTRKTTSFTIASEMLKNKLNKGDERSL
jgi:hypothetical protein